MACDDQPSTFTMKSIACASNDRATGEVLFAALLLVLTAGCGSNPVAKSDRMAAEAGASREIIAGAGFDHIGYFRGLSAEAKTVRIYIGGDGQAFLNARQVARDPTPRRPVALQLMLSDPQPAVYLARPCYHGSAVGPLCHPRNWTMERYSEAVISSMAAALGRILERYPQAEPTLIGYSGGGVIALLVSYRVSEVATVLTLAAPLDVEEWASIHGYTPLKGSINPADLPLMRTSLRQIHLQGALDRNVVPTVAQRFRSQQSKHPSIQFRIIDGIDHSCCWLDLWPAILAGLGRRTPPAEWTLVHPNR